MVYEQIPANDIQSWWGSPPSYWNSALEEAGGHCDVGFSSGALVEFYHSRFDIVVRKWCKRDWPHNLTVRGIRTDIHNYRHLSGITFQTTSECSLDLKPIWMHNLNIPKNGSGLAVWTRPRLSLAVACSCILPRIQSMSILLCFRVIHFWNTKKDLAPSLSSVFWKEMWVKLVCSYKGSDFFSVIFFLIYIILLSNSIPPSSFLPVPLFHYFSPSIIRVSIVLPLTPLPLFTHFTVSCPNLSKQTMWRQHNHAHKPLSILLTCCSPPQTRGRRGGRKASVWWRVMVTQSAAWEPLHGSVHDIKRARALHSLQHLSVPPDTHTHTHTHTHTQLSHN